MISGKSVLGLIPCRMGSKRIPIKNIRDFNGKSLLSWAVDEAHKSRYLDRIIIASDHISIAKRRGITAFQLPAYIANSSSKSCALHVLDRYPHDLIALIQPTSPYRTAQDIDACIEIAPAFSVTAGQVLPNGAVYVSGPDCDFTKGALYEMPASRSLDIDYEHQLNAT
mgnify:CR=1 FL=1